MMDCHRGPCFACHPKHQHTPAIPISPRNPKFPGFTPMQFSPHKQATLICPFQPPADTEMKTFEDQVSSMPRSQLNGASHPPSQLAKKVKDISSLRSKTSRSSILFTCPGSSLLQCISILLTIYDIKLMVSAVCALDFLPALLRPCLSCCPV
jgi:hypothetical protein